MWRAGDGEATRGPVIVGSRGWAIGSTWFLTAVLRMIVVVSFQDSDAAQVS